MTSSFAPERPEKPKKECVITIPEGIEGMDVQTNGVHPLILVNALNMLTKHFARSVIAEAEKAVGKNPKLQEQWIDKKTKQLLGDNPGDSKFDVDQMN